MVIPWFRLCFFALIFLLTSISIEAAVPSWQIVPNESTLTFTATQNNAPVSGSFKNFSGDVHFDPVQLDKSNVHIVVDMSSIDMSYKELVDTLKSSDWFDVKLFPQAIFNTNHFTKTADNTYQAEGTLTIRDKTMPVILIFSVDEYSDTKFRAKGSGTIKRNQFGVGQGDWSKTDDIRDDVQINFTLSAVKK